MTSSTLVKQLRDTGINASEYARGPLGWRAFAIAIQRKGPAGTLKIFEGHLNEVEVHTDKRYRQATLTVSERPRNIIRLVSLGNLSTNKFSPKVAQAAEREFRGKVEFPRGSNPKITVSKGHFFRSTFADKESEWRWEGNVTARVGSTEMHLLTGMDETYHFIAGLPHAARSVKEAHEILKPDAMRLEEENWGKAERQGEWFFVPVPDYRSRELDDYLAKNPTKTGHRFLGGGHVCHSYVATELGDFAVGLVVDTRAGGHHSPLFLQDWHKVVRNTEREVVPQGKMQRTWD